MYPLILTFKGAVDLDKDEGVPVANLLMMTPQKPLQEPATSLKLTPVTVLRLGFLKLLCNKEKEIVHAKSIINDNQKVFLFLSTYH